MTVLHDARSALIHYGAYVMTHVDVSRCLRIVGDEWSDLAAHWDDLAPDPYAAEIGTTRLRRYGRFAIAGRGEPLALPHTGFLQPLESNPLYGGHERRFAPLTEEFAGQPLLVRLLRMLGWLACGLEDAERWIASVHPFRVLANEGAGQPTPEGMHRDGVTLVTSLLIDRSNSVGGQTTVVDDGGRSVLSTTMVEPGTLMLGDDRRTLHGVSPISPVLPGWPAQRDVLVITMAPG